MGITTGKWNDSAVQALHQATKHRMPLVHSGGCSEAGRHLTAIGARALFPEAHSPDGLLAGLLLRLNCWNEAHTVAQDLNTSEGSYWHAIIHRMEPDAFNAGYWFRRVGDHSIFPELVAEAERLSALHPKAAFHVPGIWKPEAFITFCEKAASDKSKHELALEIQDAEWNLLMEACE